MRKSEDGLSRLELGKKSGVRKGKMGVLETKGRGRKMERHSDEKQAMRGRDRGEGVCEGGGPLYLEKVGGPGGDGRGGVQLLKQGLLLLLRARAWNKAEVEAEAETELELREK